MSAEIDWKRLLYCVINAHGGTASVTRAEYEAAPIGWNQLSVSRDLQTDELHIRTVPQPDPPRNYIDRKP